MSDHDFRSFEEFWPYYLREHSKVGTRALHFAGTTTAMVAIAAGILMRRPALLAAAPVVGYGMAWIGHFFVEKNRPATFKYPLLSFLGDMKMWRMTVSGTLDAEIERSTRRNSVHREDAERYGASAAASGWISSAASLMAISFSLRNQSCAPAPWRAPCAATAAASPSTRPRA